MESGKRSVRRALVVLPSIGVALVALASVPAQNGAPAEPRAFKPPRIAVLEVSRLYEVAGKKRGLDARISGALRDLDRKARDLQAAHRKTLEELKNVRPGTPQHRELTLRARGEEYDLEGRRAEGLQAVQQKKLEEMKEIGLQLSVDIARYAEGMGIDLVLDRAIVAGTEAGEVRWPIVHYARPEYDITGELAQRIEGR